MNACQRFTIAQEQHHQQQQRTRKRMHELMFVNTHTLTLTLTLTHKQKRNRDLYTAFWEIMFIVFAHTHTGPQYFTFHPRPFQNCKYMLFALFLFYFIRFYLVSSTIFFWQLLSVFFCLIYFKLEEKKQLYWIYLEIILDSKKIVWLYYILKYFF